MKRAVVIGLLAGFAGILGMGLGLSQWAPHIPTATDARTSLKQVYDSPSVGNYPDSYIDHVKVMSDAMEELGYEDTGLVGTEWKGKECRSFTYLVDPMGQRLFFFTRDPETGQISVLNGDQVNEELHRHIPFEGSFSFGTFPFKDLGQFYYIGRVPDKDAADVYVRINPDACGVQVDHVAYRGFLRTEIVKVNIRLLPGY